MKIADGQIQGGSQWMWRKNMIQSVYQSATTFCISSQINWAQVHKQWFHRQSIIIRLRKPILIHIYSYNPKLQDKWARLLILHMFLNRGWVFQRQSRLSCPLSGDDNLGLAEDTLRLVFVVPPRCVFCIVRVPLIRKFLRTPRCDGGLNGIYDCSIRRYPRVRVGMGV